MDKIAKLLDDYRRNIIDDKQLQSRLDAMAFLEENRATIDQQRLMQKIAEQGLPIHKSPEEVLLEKERRIEILNLLEQIRLIIGDYKWKIFCWYVIDNLSQDKIGKRLNKSQQAISSMLKRIQKKIFKYLEKYVVKDGDFSYIYEGLNPIFVKTTHSLTILGYPVDFLQQAGKGSRFKTKKNSAKRYTCLLPEYIRADGSNTVCSLCYDEAGNSKCTRKRVNN